jgi:hypothetical protein
MVPEVGLAPTSQRLQRCANLPQLLGGQKDPNSKHQIPEKLQNSNTNLCEFWILNLPWSLELWIWSLRSLVVPRGNAPRSSGYRPGALLLSYRTLLAEGHHSGDVAE